MLLFLVAQRSTPYLIRMFRMWIPCCESRYATNGLGFAKIDAGRYPKAAKDFGIDTHANSKQVPTIILFKNGKEVRQFCVKSALSDFRKQ